MRTPCTRLLVRSALLIVPVLAACRDDHPLTPAPAPSDAGARLAVSTAGAAPYPYRCATSLVPDQAAANVELRNSYVDWLSARVTSSGTKAAGQLRVDGGPQFNGGTVSEGQGYGMLLAAYLGDKKTFDELWAYSKAYHNANKVMSWHIDASGNVVDKNAATDADEDMAFALLLADKKWGGYWNDLNALLGAMKQHMVEAGTYVLKPGDVWGGSHALYVSYLAPAYYKAFAAYVGDPFWNNVADKSYQIIANINDRGQNATTGLVPDYAQASGAPVDGSNPDDYWFSWDAIRSPWRLAKDAVWNCDTRAKAQLDKMNPFFADPNRGGGPTGIKSGYELGGTVTEPWHSVAFVGPLTAAALVSSDGTYKTDMWKHTVELRTTDYYSAELRLLGMLLASGNMEDPLAGQRRRQVDDFESGTLSNWWTARDGAGSTLSASVIRPAAVGYGMEVNYSVVNWALVGTSPNQDWSGYRSFEFWVRGGGTGNTLSIEIEDADGELFRHTFVDDFTGWKFSSVPLDTNGFPRRTDWQPVTTDNGMTLTTVKALRIAPLGGQGSFAVDRIELIPK